MRFRSTRSSSQSLTLSEAIGQSIAPDGGLYVPAIFPTFNAEDFAGVNAWNEISKRLLEPFFRDDNLHAHLSDICDEAFNFPITLRFLNNDTAVLELFHGPTAAFKDVGARFLAACVARMPGRRTIIVATSGDTGGAVAAAFAERSNVEVVILFPKGKISARQQQQLTCWGDSVRAFAVRGVFDDCQRIVKTALADREWSGRRGLLSANSINLGRLLPQTVYYAASSLWYFRQCDTRPGYIIPTGNLGNAVAAFWTKAMGLPIRATLANAMDVGNPSNFERLQNLHSLALLRQIARAFSVTDEQISQTIAAGIDRWEQIWCPHTATAVHVRERLAEPDWIITATAHPAKFDSIVEPLIKISVPTPLSLAAVLERPSRFEEIEPTFAALAQAL
ncbi:MAG: threonine synthase [Acidobacteria bacterium]|nr:MAG: threonine synthase [Acidobacteriota bacterium]